ncbi:MAG: TVP38/TMEM64 family protein [Bacilli bacterium]|nr:TVP38/TMEM64 family protein [Bacilli bacterium]
MGELIEKLTGFIGQFGIFSGFLLVFLESMVPVLPLSVFVAVNIFTYGSLIGFLVSYFGTVVGCICAYFLCKKFNDYFEKKYKGNQKVKDLKKKLKKTKLPVLVVILAIPFTPAFAINIAAGLTGYDFKKFLVAVLIGKLPMIYFWSFIGASLKESLTDWTILVRIVVMLVVTYLVSMVVNKFINND